MSLRGVIKGYRVDSASEVSSLGRYDLSVKSCRNVKFKRENPTIQGSWKANTVSRADDATKTPKTG